MATLEEDLAGITAPELTPLSSSTVPAGYTIGYFVEPKRRYEIDGVEVPSVTTVLGCLDKPALPWWGMKMGVAGVLALIEAGALGWSSVSNTLAYTDGPETVIGTDENIVKLLTANKLTVNHQRDKAAVRGVGAHNAFEAWAITGKLPDPDAHPIEEKGYVKGLLAFCNDIGDAWETSGVEVMVGSKEHGFAGRYDLRGKVNRDVRLVTKACTKDGKPLVKGAKYTTVPAGTTLLVDLKSSKSIYSSHLMQLEGYEGAGIECGYDATDARAVLHITADGLYQFKRARATYDDFLAVLHTYYALESVKKALA